MTKEKEVFFACLDAVCNNGMSVADACEKYGIFPSALVAALKRIPSTPADEIYEFVTKRSVTTIMTASARREKNYLQFGELFPSRPSNKRVAPGLSTTPKVPSIKRKEGPPPFDSAGAFANLGGMSPNLPQFDMQAEFSAELAALLPFDIYASTAGVSTMFDDVSGADAGLSNLSDFSLASLPQEDSFAVQNLTSSDLLGGLPITQIHSTVAPNPGLGEGHAAQHSFSGQFIAPDAAQQQVYASDIGPVQSYVQAHPGDGMVIQVSPEMITATHKEFLHLADSFGNLVDEHKTAILYALIEVCSGLTMEYAARANQVEPQFLMGMMHALHASSPLNVLLWLNEPPAEHDPVPPGFYAIVAMQQTHLSPLVGLLAAHRFEPHAQMYYQHPLSAAPHALWEANYVGAQPMPMW
jgi:hypothetical protein